MKNTIAIILSSILVAGCADRQNVPGSIPSGNIDEIVNGAEGASGRGGLNDIRAVPLAQVKKPTRPTMTDPLAATVWVYPRQSPDELSYHDGYFIHTVVRTHTFSVIDAYKNESIPLNMLENIVFDKNGKIILNAEKVTLSERDVGNIRSTRPWSEGGQNKTVQTTIVLDDNGRKSSSTFNRPAEEAPLINNGRLDSDRLNQMIGEANRKAAEAQSNAANGQGSFSGQK